MSHAATFTGTELSQIFGVSSRRLQWWDENQIVSPRVEKHKRLYTLEQAALVGQ